MVEIRYYRDEDYEQVRSLLDSCGLFTRNPDTQEELGEKIRRDPESIIVAEDSGRIVGNVYLMEDGWNAFLFRFAVVCDEDCCKLRARRLSCARLYNSHRFFLQKLGLSWFSSSTPGCRTS